MEWPREASARRTRLREWVAANAPAGYTGPSDPRHPRWERRLAGARLLCPAWPAEYGGAGFDAAGVAQLDEECARAGVRRVERGHGERSVGPAVLAHGTPAQRDRLLPPIVRGEAVYCVGFTEADHGSDLTAVAATGVVQGGEIVLTGTKTMVAGAATANRMLVLCRTAPAESSCVVVDPGGRVRDVRDLTGAPGPAEVVLDGLRAPLADVIGGTGAGLAVAATVLRHEREAALSGEHTRRLEQFRDLVDDARKNGRSADPAIRSELAWAYGRLTLLRRFALRAPARAGEAELAELMRGEYHRRFGELAVRVSGAAALTGVAGRWQEAWLAAQGESLRTGGAGTHRTAVAEALLGLPE